METRTLPGTDLTVSRACLGTMTFGGQADETTSRRIVDIALDGGVTFLDTANVYNQGVTEEILGRVLEGRRDRVVVATKVRAAVGGVEGLSAAAIRHALDDSLRRLRTDYVDVYYLHAPDRSVPIEESLGALDELVRAGKVRYPASSNYAGWEVAEQLWITEREGWAQPRITQPMYNLLARGIEQEYLPMCRRFGVSTVVYNPLAGGMLTGKQSREAPLPGGRFTEFPTYVPRYWHDRTFDAVDELVAIAAAAGRSPVELALGWLLHHSGADCAIVGASRPEQIEENVRAFATPPLPADAVEACDRVWQRLRGTTPVYNR